MQAISMQRYQNEAPHRVSVTIAVLLLLMTWAPNTQAITYATNDTNSPDASVVVRVVSQNNLCTGTLITPTAVLTAKHCVIGTDSSFNPPAPPAQLPFTVCVGSPINPVPGNPCAGAIESTQAFATGVYGNYEPLNSQELGADLAILWLSQPLFNSAHIVRPDLASPVPADGDDGEGGIYNVPMGAAGWSPAPDHVANQRQVVFFTDDLKHFSGYPDGGDGTPSGQYWVHAQGHTGSLEPGDSGGPLFWQQPDGTRQVLGVADSVGVHFLGIDGFDCSFGRCDIWTDVTRDNTARWIRDQMEDRSRSVPWLDAHRRGYTWDSNGTFHPDYWKGEVDYTGPCDVTLDPDCDHWYSWNDDCPTFYDPAQFEGTLCPLPPPPLPAFPPQNCRPFDLCNDGVDFQCDMINEVVVLKRLDHGNYHDVSSDTDASRAHIPFISDYPGDGRDSASYQVCSRNTTGDTCTTPLSVTFPHDACSSGGGGGGGGDVPPRQCGRFGQPKCGPILFE